MSGPAAPSTRHDVGARGAWLIPWQALRRLRRPQLWALLSVAVVVDLLASAGVLPLPVGIVSGLVGLGCAAALVAAAVPRRWTLRCHRCRRW